MYTIFYIPKRDGKKYRRIEAPEPNLKVKQRRLLTELGKIAGASPFAFGFVKNKNIAQNAKIHEGSKFILKIDINNFFPSITYDNFEKEVSRQDSRILELVKEHKDELFWQFEDDKCPRLPQGAPTSPMLSNIFLYKFDWIIAWKAYKNNVRYSRYADDIILSGDDPKVLKYIYTIIKYTLNKMGLTVNYKKVHLLSNKTRQTVTGLVVNQKANLQRKLRKRIRAALFQAKVNNKIPDARIRGYLALQNMITTTNKPDNNIEICTILEVSKQI